MKKMIIALLSAMTLTLSGFALAGAAPVPAPVVDEAPEVVAEPVVDEAPAVVEVATPTEEQEPAATCQPSDQKECATDDTAEVEETPVQQEAAS